MKYVLAIDQGTTGTRSILFDSSGSPVASAYREIRQIYPKPGWVEHDPVEIWQTVQDTMRETLAKSGADVTAISAIGITNQRETTVLWDKRTGKPVHNAIVWQCRRGAPMCEDLKRRGLEELVNERTGLTIDPYFSATKIKWVLDNVPEASALLREGRLAFGCIDSWLVWNLSGGKAHVTDPTNASRTMLFDIRTGSWDGELCREMGIPLDILPRVVESSGYIADCASDVLGASIPIAGILGDQQAGLFGQCCFRPGMAKNTYGTALALLCNIGEKPIRSKAGLTTDLAVRLGGKTIYAFEGVVFIGGAAIQWLRDGLGIIRNAAETEEMARSVSDTGGVYFVPAFAGLSVPVWDMYARGLLIGLTRGTTRAHIARAALESLAYQTRDAMEGMISDYGSPLVSMRVDGGASENNFLMQFQADILGVPVERPAVKEMASRGAAYVAGLGVGLWKSLEDLERQWTLERRFEPQMPASRREELYARWRNAMERSRNWARE